MGFQIRPPVAGERYAAGMDTCTLCRLTAGFELTTWVPVPVSQLQLLGEQSFEPASGSSQCYESSAGVFRYFCKTCGAAAFVAKQNQDWVDIPAGLLRAEEGKTAEKWLELTELGFPEETTDKDLVGDLKQCFKT